MQGVTKLVEQCGNLIPSNQCGLPLRSLGIVGYIIYYWQLLAQTTLLSKSAHPCTTTLCWTAIWIAIEKSKQFTILIVNLIHFHIRMICRDVGTAYKSQTINTMCSIEDTINNNTIDIEIRLNLIVAQIQHFLLHLGRIIETIIRLQLKVCPHLFLGIVLDSLCLGLSLWCVLCNKLLKEAIDIVRVFSHSLLKRIRCIILISHQLPHLCSQLGNLNNNWECIELTCTVCTMTRCLVNTATQITIIQT